MGIFGQLQIVCGSFEHQFGQVLAQRAVDFLEHIAGLGKGQSQSLPHTDGLTALSGEYQCALHANLLKKLDKTYAYQRTCQIYVKPVYYQKDSSQG